MVSALLVSVPEWLRSLLTLFGGPLGLVVVFVYSFLVAFVLPFPGEVVLFLPLDLDLSRNAELAAIILVSSVGKALGSLVAMRVEHGAKAETERLTDLGSRLRSDFEERVVDVAETYGYVGLTLLLSVPLMPDTVTVYGFGVLELDYSKFAAATFLGSVLRLLVTLALVRGALSVV